MVDRKPPEDRRPSAKMSASAQTLPEK